MMLYYRQTNEGIMSNPDAPKTKTRKGKKPPPPVRTFADAPAERPEKLVILALPESQAKAIEALIDAIRKDQVQ